MRAASLNGLIKQAFAPERCPAFTAAVNVCSHRPIEQCTKMGLTRASGQGAKGGIRGCLFARPPGSADPSG